MNKEETKDYYPAIFDFESSLMECIKVAEKREE